MTLSHISCSYIIPYYIPSCQPTISKSNIIHILSIQIFVSHDCPTYNILIYFPFTSGSSPTSPLIHSHKIPLIYHPYAIHILFPFIFISNTRYIYKPFIVHSYSLHPYHTTIHYSQTILYPIPCTSIHTSLIPYIHLYLSFHTHIPFPSILLILIPYSYLSYISLIIASHIVLPETASSLRIFLQQRAQRASDHLFSDFVSAGGSQFLLFDSFLPKAAVSSLP